MIRKQIELKDEGTQIFQTRAKLELLGQALKAFHSSLKSLHEAWVLFISSCLKLPLAGLRVGKYF